MYGCLLFIYILYLYSPFFSEQNRYVAAKKRGVIHKGKMESGNFSAVLRRDAQGRVTTIFQTVQRYALSLVRNVNNIVDVEVWIMGGVVLQGLGMPMVSKAKMNK
jgi:hypothetical protein